MCLLADINIKMLLRIFFGSLAIVILIWFLKQKLIWRLYFTIKALLIIKLMKLINKNEFAKVLLNKNFEIFMIYVATQEVLLS